MDRDPRSRQQKPAGVPPRAPANRGMKSRLGLTKKGAAPARAARPGTGAPGQMPRQAAPRPPQRPAPQHNPQKGGYRPDGRTHPPRRVTHAELLRQRRHRAALGMLVVVGALALGVILSVNLLFKVSSFRIENTDGTTPADTGIYTEQQILDLLGVQEGDNLFGFSPKEKSEFLLSNLPYLDVATVAVQIPNTVVIKVQPAKERFALEYGGQWVVLSDALKVLRTEGAQPDGLILLEAQPQEGQATVPGSFMQLKSQGSAQAATGESARAGADEVLAALMEQLESCGLLEKTTLISLADMSELNFLYEGRISVKLGTANDLAYKVRFVADVILDVEGSGLSASDRGTLDASHQYTDGTGYVTFQSAVSTPTPAPTEQPAGEETDSEAAETGGEEPQAEE